MPEPAGRRVPVALDELIHRAWSYAMIGLAIVGVLTLFGFVIKGTVVVEKGKLAILIKKTGDDLPSGQIIAASGSQKGIQLEPLTEGWYWRNPYTWDWIIIDQIQIPMGKLGIKVGNFGAELDPGQVIARSGQKGIQPDTLRPGRYAVNTFAYSVEQYPAIDVPPGHLGVVTLVSGKDPANPNDFLVEKDERGVQKYTLPPGTYYPHPFVERIVPVDARSHRFDMRGDMIIRFPSLDGFDISMEGTIEWKVDPARASEVFVKYVEEKKDIISCIVDEIILPNARAYSRIEGSKHLARDFISGVTREKFQEQFREGVQRSCAAQGILIQSALVRDTVPPEAIAKPIKEREIAIRMRDMYTQEKEREKQQKLLAMEEKMKERKTMVNQAEADVAVSITAAQQEKEVALIEAKRQLEVAKLQIQAAQNQGEARVAEGKAKADVIKFKNAAEASGLKTSVEAFGDGDTYVRYLANQKLAPSIQYILSNTEGPFIDLFKRLTVEKKP